MKILLLEDDTALANILVDFLEESYEVTQTYSIQKALALCEAKKFDLYIFDINLPDGDGISLLKVLRDFHDETPAIFITAFEDVRYLKSAFSSGGDDYIKKPFEFEELAQRIENIKKHFGLHHIIQINDEIRIDTNMHQIHTADKTIHLTKRECACLYYLYQHKNRIVTPLELIQNFWEYDEMPGDDAIRTIIKNLRKHIGKQHIVNIRGEGYKFE